MNRIIIQSAAIAIIYASAAFGDEQSWSRFRGPNGSGVSHVAKLPTEFGPEKNLAWRTELPAGHSSPVILDDKIFVTAAENQKLFTICLDRSTGDQCWRAEAPRSRTEKLDHRNHPASPSPVVDNDAVHVFFPDFGLISYSLDGHQRWRLPLGPFNNLYGMGASPIVVDDLVVLVCDQNLDSFMVAVNKNDGSVAWNVKRTEATSGHCSPIIYRPNGGDSAQIIVPGSFYLTAYEATTGKKLWWVGGLCFEMKSTPVIHRDAVFINGYGSPQNQPETKITIDLFADVLAKKDADNDSRLSLAEMPDKLSANFFPAIDLDQNAALDEREWNYFRASIASENSMMSIQLGGSGDMTTTNLLWKYHKNIPQLPSPLVYDNRLYMISDRGIVTCFDPSRGQVLFRGRLDGAQGNVYASPVAADGKIYFVTLAGKIAVVRAGDDLEILAVNDLAEKCYATPAIVENHIYVRTEKALYCFGQ